MKSSSYPSSHPGDIQTSSRLRAWYLVHVRGYAIAQHREAPRVTRLGRLTYVNLWLLRPADAPVSRGEETAAKG